MPYYIECLDVSNLYKQDVVAARIKKAVATHYPKFLAKERPNLLIVDGGKEQVKAAQQVLKALALPVPVIGLVKNEKHRTTKIITSELTELDFGPHERIRNFFTNCQEEVHRYALNFHRKLHRQTALQNI
ncbi:23912_t:CDS:2 [Racocetra persica]|uniref:23912_t:CDS:1 n=1 Tax=Racocetra persica TaxID=160502 RepID=A0ACA9QI84_9GLOM|nr:23912_t:CDS:2 [Racocetra persica]